MPFAPTFRNFPHRARLAAAVGPGDESLPVVVRAQLGVSPDHEIIDVTDVDVIGRYTITRGQDGTAAADWPAGTPLTWLPALDHAGSPTVLEPNVHSLGRALPAASTRLNLRRAHRRIKIDAEICWITSIGGHRGERLEVVRGRENTTIATHDVGADVTYLAAGES